MTREIEIHPEYSVYNREGLAVVLSQVQAVREKLGGDPKTWSIQEIGDGNINLIFKVTGKYGQILVKQAIPYLRCVGESWPLSLSRMTFEHQAFEEYRN